MTCERNIAEYLVTLADLLPSSDLLCTTFHLSFSLSPSFFFLSAELICVSLREQRDANEVQTLQSGTLKAKISRHSLGK